MDLRRFNVLGLYLLCFLASSIHLRLDSFPWHMLPSFCIILPDALRLKKLLIRLGKLVFQFFCLAGLPQEDRLADEKNLPKYEWQHLNDLRPLEVTSTTDMSADWKLSGVGGWS